MQNFCSAMSLNQKAICQNICSVFADYKSNLTEVSRDKTNDQSPIDDPQFSIFNFDNYIKEQTNQKYPLNSNDAFFIDNKGHCYLIEFKNGSLFERKQLKKELRFGLTAKNACSLFVLRDRNLIPDYDFARKHFTYIFVYNAEHDANSNKLYDYINKYSFQQQYKLFDLDKQYINVFFNDVYTYSADEFIKMFVKKVKSFPN